MSETASAEHPWAGDRARRRQKRMQPFDGVTPRVHPALWDAARASARYKIERIEVVSPTEVRIR